MAMLLYYFYQLEMGGYFCISVGGDYHWTGGYIQRIDLHQNINYIAICSSVPYPEKC